MPGSPAEVKLVSNAMANATRRKIMVILVEKERKNSFARALGSLFSNIYWAEEVVAAARPAGPACVRVAAGPG